MKEASPVPVTTVFRRRIRAGFECRYEGWLAGISEAVSDFRGSQGTTILRPPERGSEYVAITQFESAESLHAWLTSAERERWMSKLDAVEVCREDVSTLAGTERWLTLSPDRGLLPPRYKTAALVLLGLYPLVLVLDMYLGPLLSNLPGPVALLLSLLVSVAIMVWSVLPLLTRLFHGWLHPGADRRAL